MRKLKDLCKHAVWCNSSTTCKTSLLKYSLSEFISDLHRNNKSRDDSVYSKDLIRIQVSNNFEPLVLDHMKEA